MSRHSVIPIHPVAAAAPLGLVEGIARVVGVAGDRLWLEPEQTTSCGSCASSASCGTQETAGIGSVASRLHARRFAIDMPAGPFSVGERIVVGVGERSLLKAALIAYGLPLVSALLAGATAEGRYGEDGLTLLGVMGGLAAGLLLARWVARGLAAKGELAPRYLRRARPGETCGSGS